MTNLLEITELTVTRGSLVACDRVTLSVPAGEITVVLGANGSGKSALLDGIAGVLPAVGSLTLAGERIDRLPVHARAKRGLAYVQQGHAVFSQLTVAENLAVVNSSAHTREQAFDLFPQLAQRQHTAAGLLSGGEQQMLVLARALATSPRMLLIDELSQGLAPVVVETLMRALSQLASTGTGVLLVEQFAELALQVGTTAHVMSGGRIVHSARCASLLDDRGSSMLPFMLGE